MEPIVYILVAAVVVVVAAALVLRARGTRRQVPLEPSSGPASVKPTDESPVAVDEGVEQPAAEVAPPPAVQEPQPEPEPERPSFFDRLGRARSAFGGYLSGVFGGSVDDDTWDDLEEALIRADVGVATSLRLISEVREDAKAADATTGEEILPLLKARMAGSLDHSDRTLKTISLDTDAIAVVLFVGVNGVGKTTTIGKLAKRFTSEGMSVMMAAGDTFRAAAAEQLGTWAERSGAEIVRGSEGGDPSSVVFDAVAAASSRNLDLVLADTAGRLHTKSNLMDELSKVKRVAQKERGDVVETLLVIDATTGQNGMAQAKQFTEAVEVTGVVLTKLDGSAKGGIVFAIESELGIPVKLVGLGEGVDDLVDFDPDQFVNALFE